MKDKPHISIFRKQLSFNVQKGISIVIYLKHFLEREDYLIDWDVYLPSKGMNLQRPFVWTLFQKQNLILSILKGVKIPSISVILKENSIISTKIYQIIDGKQRLSTMLSYLKGEFPIVWNGEEYFYSDLHPTAQSEISLYSVLGDLTYEDDTFVISDEDKIAWFEMINFAGTIQDEEHLKNLKK